MKINYCCGLLTMYIAQIFLLSLSTHESLAVSILRSTLDNETEKENTNSVFNSTSNFLVCAKTPEKFHLPLKFKSPHDIIEDLEAYQNYKYVRNIQTEILQTTAFPRSTHSSANGFVNAVTDAYRGHHNLVIRPDDIWGAIMTQFSFYLNKHAEKFRKKLVSFEGKKDLVVQIPGTIRSAPYDLFVQLMTEQINANLIDPRIRDWALPNFSTTTENDIVTIGVLFMATMKQYFNYGAAISCGIPSITLEGTVEDWQDIHQRLSLLKDYDLKEWYFMLEPILQQLIAVKNGKVDLPFWEKIVHIDYVYEGCTQDQYITGWITAFTYFETNGKKLHKNKDPAQEWPKLNVNNIPSGLVEVDLKILDNGATYNATLFAGHLAFQVKDTGYTLQPYLGWGIVLHAGKVDENSDFLPMYDDFSDISDTI